MVWYSGIYLLFSPAIYSPSILKNRISTKCTNCLYIILDPMSVLQLQFKSVFCLNQTNFNIKPSSLAKLRSEQDKT